MTSEQSQITGGVKPPDEIIVLALRAISGEVTTNMRAIALGHRDSKAKFLFYMDRAPTDCEKECAEVIATNFDAGHPTKLEKLDIEFVVTNEYIGKLDMLDFMIFHRHEGYD